MKYYSRRLGREGSRKEVEMEHGSASFWVVEVEGGFELPGASEPMDFACGMWRVR